MIHGQVFEFFFREKARREGAATKNELTTKNAKIAKKNQHKFLSMCSLRSFAAKICPDLSADGREMAADGARRMRIGGLGS